MGAVSLRFAKLPSIEPQTVTPPKSLPGRFKWPEMVFGRLPSRRLWLRQTAWVGLAAFSHSERGQGQEPAAATEIEGAPEEVQARAKKAGLPPLRVQSGDRYVAIGNASKSAHKFVVLSYKNTKSQNCLVGYNKI